jgi:molybdopterin-guanine dinucleotide biosynthesis protein B
MTAPKTVSIIGFKDSGKTRVVEAIVKEFSSRGIKTGTIKHTAENMELDTPGKDTSRHKGAGAKASAILQDKAAAIFIDEHLTLLDAVSRLGNLDFLVIEGFKSLNTNARVLVPRSDEDLTALRNGLEIAVVRMPSSDLSKDLNLPIFNISEAHALANLILDKAYPVLPGVDCNGCGYDDCLSLGKAILSGEATALKCTRNTANFQLSINGNAIPLNNFVRQSFSSMLLGFVRTLKGGENANKVEIKFEVDEDD